MDYFLAQSNFNSDFEMEHQKTQKHNRACISWMQQKNLMLNYKEHAKLVSLAQLVIQFCPNKYTKISNRHRMKKKICQTWRLGSQQQAGQVVKCQLIKVLKASLFKFPRLHEIYMSMEQNQVLTEQQHTTQKIVINNICLINISIIFNNQFYQVSGKSMNKYKTIQVIKQKNDKIIERAFLVNNNDQKYYILKSYPNSDSKSIENQLEVYQSIKQPHLNGFPEIKEGFRADNRLYLVFEELGDNLEYLRQKCGGRLSLKTTVMVGLQMLQRIQFLHENGFLHGDIKPSNFLMGKTGKLKHKLYMVDFQLSKPYAVKGKHIEEKSIESFSGCLRFCSVNANKNKLISRRDELESFIYCLIFLLKGQLPWMHIKAKNIIQAYNLIGAIKIQKQADLLQGLPYETFKNLLNYVQREIKFKEKPNYSYIRKQLMALMKRNGYQLDYKHDWEYL